jgi:hypothetical protein
MRGLSRNKSTVWVALYKGTEAMFDDDGYETGEYAVVYGDAKKYRASVSPAKGSVDQRQFGDEDSYDKVVLFDCPCVEIDEASVLWVDIEPRLGGQHDYRVVKVARSLNATSVAIRKVSVSG